MYEKRYIYIYIVEGEHERRMIVCIYIHNHSSSMLPTQILQIYLSQIAKTQQIFICLTIITRETCIKYQKSHENAEITLYCIG